MTHTRIERIFRFMGSTSLTGAPRQIRGLEIEMRAQEILATARNANGATVAAESLECNITQDWTGGGSTSYLFKDGSVLVVSGPQINAFDSADGAACEWHNSTDKAALLDWATRQSIDIGQGGQTLDADWNERLIDAYAANLRAR